MFVYFVCLHIDFCFCLMSLFIYLLTYLLAYLLTYLLTYLFVYNCLFTICLLLINLVS